MSVRDTLKRFAFKSGALSSRHRRRNSEHLTVAMFHRVLPERDARFEGADPEWTLTDVLFRDCLEFFAQNYSVLTPEDLEAFRSGGARLPSCPLVLTFDDGWADNAEFALPILREFDMSGYVFVVSDAIDRAEAFWQEQLCDAWQRKTLEPNAWQALWSVARAESAATELDWNERASLRQLVHGLESLDASGREEALAPVLAGRPATGSREMVSSAQVSELASAGIRIGSHGKTHTPFPKSADLEAEIGESKRVLERAIAGEIKTLSFPHGQYDALITQRCKEAGYEILFTSDECLNDVSNGALPKLLGRVNIPAHEIANGAGRLAPERLATWLFGREARCLS